jgi:hypothetical protein
VLPVARDHGGTTDSTESPLIPRTIYATAAWAERTGRQHGDECIGFAPQFASINELPVATHRPFIVTQTAVPSPSRH